MTVTQMRSPTNLLIVTILVLIGVVRLFNSEENLEFKTPHEIEELEPPAQSTEPEDSNVAFLPSPLPQSEVPGDSSASLHDESLEFTEVPLEWDESEISVGHYYKVQVLELGPTTTAFSLQLPESGAAPGDLELVLVGEEGVSEVTEILTELHKHLIEKEQESLVDEYRPNDWQSLRVSQMASRNFKLKMKSQDGPSKIAVYLKKR